MSGIERSSSSASGRIRLVISRVSLPVWATMQLVFHMRKIERTIMTVVRSSSATMMVGSLRAATHESVLQLHRQLHAAR